jgi:hypothetical protein
MRISILFDVFELFEYITIYRIMRQEVSCSGGELGSTAEI